MTALPELFPPPITISWTARQPSISNPSISLLGPLPDLRLEAFLPPQADASGIPFRLIRDAAQPSQGYHLSWQPDQVELRAACPEGFRNGLLSLSQLLASDELPPGEITDAPAFPVRGFMLDVSRCRVPSMETMSVLIRQLAALKYNQLQLYTEHTFAYQKHAVVWADASPFTAAEIQQMDQWCQQQLIELVPNQNSFGHMERWLKHQAYRHLAEKPDGYASPWGGEHREASTIRPDAKSLAFLQELYEELLPNFNSRLFNVGCDETFELGQGASQARCEAEGKGRVYLDFLQQVHALVTAQDRQMMFWGDIIHEHPELIAELPADLIALEWGYEAGHPFAEHCQAFAQAGIPFYVCPGTSSWRSIVGRTTNMQQNLREAALAGQAAGAAGFLLTDWGDLGHLQPWPVSFPGIVEGAAQAWHPGCDTDLGPMTDRCFDLPHGLGDLLLDAGRVHDGISRKSLTNASPLFHLLLSKSHPEWQPTAKEEEHCRREFDAIAAQLATLPVQQAVTELQLGVDLLRFALRCDQSLPQLIDQHRRTWLARNRPGGLAESAAWLEAECQ